MYDLMDPFDGLRAGGEDSKEVGGLRAGKRNVYTWTLYVRPPVLIWRHHKYVMEEE